PTRGPGALIRRKSLPRMKPLRQSRTSYCCSISIRPLDINGLDPVEAHRTDSKARRIWRKSAESSSASIAHSFAESTRPVAQMKWSRNAGSFGGGREGFELVEGSGN